MATYEAETTPESESSRKSSASGEAQNEHEMVVTPPDETQPLTSKVAQQRSSEPIEMTALPAQIRRSSTLDQYDPLERRPFETDPRGGCKYSSTPPHAHLHS
jgi:hypothetical protein